MKKHEAIATIHLFELECGHCSEWFRTESEINEEPRSAWCAHCGVHMYDDDDVSWTDRRHLGYLEIDLFAFRVVKTRLYENGGFPDENGLIRCKDENGAVVFERANENPIGEDGA